MDKGGYSDAYINNKTRIEHLTESRRDANPGRPAVRHDNGVSLFWTGLNTRWSWR